MEKLVEILNQQTGNFFKENNIDVKEIDFLSKNFYNENGGFAEVAMIRIGYMELEKIKYLNIYNGIGMRTNIKNLSFTITDEKIDFNNFPISVYGSVVTSCNMYNLISEMYDLYQDDDEYINNIVSLLEEATYLIYSFKINVNDIKLSDVENIRKAYENVLKLYEESLK